MALSEELKKIKHIYGEEFMKLCRTEFPTILEQEGMLLDILENNFANNSRSLARDIIDSGRAPDFKDYVFSKYSERVHADEVKKEIAKNPYEILKEAGYTLYECNNEAEIQSYRKYYAPGEHLCTFEGGRLNKCMCFWAVKDNALDIKREDFTSPDREDEYSTSVLAIQFDKYGLCRTSIKSRYNHTVINPDCTYGNDLDRIADGLSTSFERLLKERGYEFESAKAPDFYLLNYRRVMEGKLYRYNFHEDGVSYCPGNIIIGDDGEVETLPNPEQQVLIDNYVLDLKNKTLSRVAAGRRIQEDSFPQGFRDIEKIDRQRDKTTGETTFTLYMKDKAPATIVTDSLNQIVEYSNPNLTELGDGFMRYNRALRKLDTPNVQTIGSFVLRKNIELKEINLAETKTIGAFFLADNEKLEEVVAPNLKEVGNNALQSNDVATKVEAPQLKKVGRNFMADNTSVKTFRAPKLTTIGEGFMETNARFDNIVQPNRKLRGIDIADLDRKSMVTKSEISQIERAINWLKNKVHDLLGRDNDNER